MSTKGRRLWEAAVLVTAGLDAGCQDPPPQSPATSHDLATHELSPPAEGGASALGEPAVATVGDASSAPPSAPRDLAGVGVVAPDAGAAASEVAAPSADSSAKTPAPTPASFTGVKLAMLIGRVLQSPPHQIHPTAPVPRSDLGDGRANNCGGRASCGKVQTPREPRVEVNVGLDAKPGLTDEETERVSRATAMLRARAHQCVRQALVVAPELASQLVSVDVRVTFGATVAAREGAAGAAASSGTASAVVKVAPASLRRCLEQVVVTDIAGDTRPVKLTFPVSILIEPQ